MGKVVDEDVGAFLFLGWGVEGRRLVHFGTPFVYLLILSQRVLRPGLFSRNPPNPLRSLPPSTPGASNDPLPEPEPVLSLLRKYRAHNHQESSEPPPSTKLGTQQLIWEG